MNGKCKIWDVVNNCWYVPTYKGNKGLEELLISMSGEVCRRKFTEGEAEVKMTVELDSDFIVLYYTGKKDNEDAKIYNRDILLFQGEYFIITWNSEAAMFSALPTDLEGRQRFCSPSYWHQAKIVGNAYDTPDYSERFKKPL